MKQTLGWTTIEQSKKLIEAGIDKTTADMCRQLTEGHFDEYPTPIPWADFTARDYFQPCWSLGALIGLLPNPIRVNNHDACLVLEQRNVRYVYFSAEVDMVICVFIGQNDNLIDNITDTIVYLLEENYIKKGE